MINIKNFDTNLKIDKIERLKLDKKSYKNINIYYIWHITINNTDYVNIHTVNTLYLIIDKVGGYIEKKQRK